jgi:hypothetical protein
MSTWLAEIMYMSTKRHATAMVLHTLTDRRHYTA